MTVATDLRSTYTERTTKSARRCVNTPGPATEVEVPMHPDRNAAHAPSQAERIPLKNRAGDIVAHALVDPDDYARLGHGGWYLARDGYVFGRLNGIDMPLHRAVLAMPSPSEDPREVDHINRDRLDNRRTNLRVLTRAQNAQNLGSRTGTSPFRGVHWASKGRLWCAKVRVGDERFRAYFKSQLKAAIAAEQARRRMMPFAKPDPELERILTAIRTAESAEAMCA